MFFGVKFCAENSEVSKNYKYEVWMYDERMAAHCPESGCIGLYNVQCNTSQYNVYPLGPRDFPQPLRCPEARGRMGCETKYIPPLGSVQNKYNISLSQYCVRELSFS